MTITREQAHPPGSQLSEYLDDDLPVKARRTVEAHLATCAACAATLDELRQVVDRAWELDEPSEPVVDLWPGIRDRIGGRAGRARPGARAWQRLAGDGPWAVAGLASAATLVVACTVAVSWLLRDRTGADVPLRPAAAPTSASAPAGADPAYAETLAGLRRVVHGRLTADPRVLDVIEENLAVIDVAIAQYREALARTPGDADLGVRLAAAEERKLAVLRRAAALAPEGAD